MKEEYILRDTAYYIPLFAGDRDDCCNGKTIRLFHAYQSKGIPVRPEIGDFRWSNIWTDAFVKEFNLNKRAPKSIEKLIDVDYETHIFLAVDIGDHEEFRDFSFDPKVSDYFPVNRPGRNSLISVPEPKIWTPEKSWKSFIKEQDIIADKDYKGVNLDFFLELNQFLNWARRKK